MKEKLDSIMRNALSQIVDSKELDIFEDTKDTDESDVEFVEDNLQ